MGRGQMSKQVTKAPGKRKFKKIKKTVKVRKNAKRRLLS